jgi:hypothetical protein
VRPRTAFNNSFAFEKVFGVDEFMAAGVLDIPVGGSKPTKPTKDNNYVRVCFVRGADAVLTRALRHRSSSSLRAQSAHACIARTSTWRPAASFSFPKVRAASLSRALYRFAD